MFLICKKCDLKIKVLSRFLSLKSQKPLQVEGLASKMVKSAKLKNHFGISTYPPKDLFI